MKSLFFEGPMALAWRSVPDPVLESPHAALVAPIAVALCDLDFAIVRGFTPFEPPFAFGHECVARVLAVGGEVRSVAPGDVVVVPFQISCGFCVACVAGHTAHCRTVPERTAMFGFGDAGGPYGGVLSDIVRVPYADAMLLRAPEGVDPVSLASCGDNVADGWRSVAPALESRPGARVLVAGGAAASVGLFSVASALASGAASVDYVDRDPARRAVAESLGARVLESYADRPKPAYEIAVDASGDVNGLRYAALALAPEGHLFVTAMYFGEATPLPLYSLYLRGAAVRTGRVNARATLPAVLQSIVSGRLQPERVTTTVAPWDAAIDAILAGTTAKLIISRAAPPL